MSNEGFSFFPRLPPGLLIKIWRLALPSFCVITIHFDIIKSKDPLWKFRAREIFDPLSALNKAICQINCKYPVILAVNHESREETLHYYSNLHGLQDFPLLEPGCIVNATYNPMPINGIRLSRGGQVPELNILEHPPEDGKRMRVRKASITESMLLALRPEACFDLEELRIVIIDYFLHVPIPETMEKVYQSGDTIEHSTGWGDTDTHNEFLRRLGKVAEGRKLVVKLVRDPGSLHIDGCGIKHDPFCFPKTQYGPIGYLRVPDVVRLLQPVFWVSRLAGRKKVSKKVKTRKKVSKTAVRKSPKDGSVEVPGQAFFGD